MSSSKGKPLLAIFSLICVVCRAAFPSRLRPEWIVDTVLQLWDRWCDGRENGEEDTRR
jgi:hypothetical protein